MVTLIRYIWKGQEHEVSGRYLCDYLDRLRRDRWVKVISYVCNVGGKLVEF